MSPLMVMLIQAIAEAYPADPSAPGLVLSLLPNGNAYGSIVRYEQKFGGGKFTVCAASCADFPSVIDSLSKQWLKCETPKANVGACVMNLREAICPTPTRFRLLEVD